MQVSAFQVKNPKNDGEAQKSSSIQEQQRRTLHLELKTVVRKLQHSIRNVCTLWM